MSHELPDPLVRSLLLAMESLGHDASAALNRMPGPARGRSPWDELLVTLESFARVEGVVQSQRLMHALATRSSAVLMATELLGDTRQTYLVLLEAAAARQNVVTITSRPAGSGGLVVHLELNRGQPSSLFFQACAWFLAAIPRARGLGDARISIERLSDRELNCLVMPPPNGNGVTLAHPDAHLRSIARQIFRHDAPALAALPTSEALIARFGFTRAEARVVRCLAEGHSIKHIAEVLRVSPETARTHAKRAMQKTDTHRQAQLVSLVLQGGR